MRLKLIVITIISLSILLTIGCSKTNSSICPEMGTIKIIDNPESPYKLDKLTSSNMPNFTWDVIDCTSLQVITGKSLSINQLEGKPIMLVFHKVMNCPGCKQQLPFIKAAYEKWKDSGLVLLTIYRSDQIQDVKGYVQDNDINFTALADPKDQVASKLGFGPSAPITVFIDKKGIIKNYNIGPLPSQEAIENILKSL